MGVPLGPCVWHRSHVFAYGDQLIEQQERFFVCRIDAHEIGDHVNLDERERAEITAYRWWTLDEIEASRDRFGPRDLAVLLRPIIEGRLPTDPIAVGI